MVRGLEGLGEPLRLYDVESYLTSAVLVCGVSTGVDPAANCEFEGSHRQVLIHGFHFLVRLAYLVQLGGLHSEDLVTRFSEAL